MAFPNLFSPIQLGSLELPNRIVHAPTDISSSHADGEVSERRSRPAGGASFVRDHVGASHSPPRAKLEYAVTSSSSRTSALPSVRPSP